jgi:ubiquinone/menaquinone biosynthesis C-methylase UbiE
MPSDHESVQTNITRFWNVVAPHYEGHPGNTVPFGSEAYQRWADLFARVLPPPPADVLDLGTGTGFSALISSSLGHNVTGVDLAPSMLEVARGMAAERSLQIRLEEGDAVAPPFEHSTFDVVTCRHVLWTLRDAQEALCNWRCLLRPGGRVVAFDGFRHLPRPATEVDPDDIFGRHFTRVVQAAIPFMHTQNDAPLIDAFKEAGYSHVTLENLPRHFADDDEEDVRPYVVVALV